MYKVTKQYARGSETDIKNFKEVSEAKNFIIDKQQEDAALNVKVTYRIYDDFDVIEIIEPGDTQSSGSGTSEGSQGASSGSRFSPTPFNTTPRPPGTPANWNRDPEENEDK